MFAGFPHFCKSGAKIPIIAPTEMIPQRVAKKFLTDVIDEPPFRRMLGRRLLLIQTSCRMERKEKTGKGVTRRKGKGRSKTPFSLPLPTDLET
jgi:hypothetical protein